MLGACSSPSVPSLVRSSSPRPSTPLAAADRQFFSGDYDGAESRYLELVKSHTTDADAHYALLLTYESRFKDAVIHAQSAVNAKATSGALARLTRALDWSQDLPAALDAGARAVAAQPVEPLAHIFYAEALSDAGRYEDAKTQLKAGERDAGNDTYTQAELDREWANYYRDRGIPGEELNHIELAQKQQPNFPDRTLELARYLFDPDHRQLTKARAALDRVRKSFGKSYSVLVSGGDTGLLGADADSALSFYKAALDLKPKGVTATLGLGTLLIANNRDFTGAHDALLNAFRAHQDSAQLYFFLRYLDQLVLKRNPSDELGSQASTAAQLDSARQEALQRVNGYRQQAGLKPLKADSHLAEAAEAHAFYFFFNYGQGSEAGLGIHTEDSALPGFTGANGLLRARHFGYAGDRAAEVINHVFSPHAAVQVWVDSVFHRLPIMDRETQAVGYGEAQVGPLSIQVMDFGIGDPTTSSPVVYPVPNQQDTPSTFLGNELPSPVPADVDYPVGYPVTLQLGGADKLTISSARLLGPTGAAVPSYTLNPGSNALALSQWSLLAKQPLQPGATYTVDLHGQLDGAPFSKRWSFTVQQY
jgi:uncharacterized protein YkwD